MRARTLLGLIVLAVSLFAPQLAAAATFTVNTNDDGDTVCAALHCSLREAINAANAAAGHDQIVFAIPPGGPQTIRPIGRSLPSITDPVTIDATTQTGFAGVPIIEIDGTLAGPGGVGFDVPAGQSVLTGFIIDGFGLGLGGTGTGYAIRLQGAGGTTITGNYIGTDVSGLAVPRPNDIGIDIDSTDNMVGGTTPAKRNVISGNGDGVLLHGTAARNTIVGNYLGTNAAGSEALPGNSRGVEIAGEAADNVVGGNLPGAGNLISGNAAGIFISSTGPGNRVQGNLIGTDVTGLAPISTTGQTGIVISVGGGVVVGGPSASDRNVVSGNESGGIYLQGPGNVVANNYVGVGVDGQTPVPNTAGGVFVDTSGNTVGVAPPGSSVQGGSNVIAHNAGQGGVVVRNGVASSILGNAIFLNAPGLGIDLVPIGPNPNDPGDADTGPNELQNTPVMTAGSTTNGTVKLDGSLSSQANTTYLVEFFANPACDTSGFGEGEELLADRFVTTDAAGAATVTFNFGSGHVGDVITATATDPAGDTSEFSNCTEAAPLASGSVTTLSPPNAVNPVGTTHTVAATVVGGSPEQPLTGIPVRYTVTGSVNTAGECTTGATGQCAFTYQGPDEPGADLIEAYADANDNGVQDPTEISGSATKEWVAGSVTSGQATGGGQIVWVTGKVVFGFSVSNNGGLKGNCHVIDVSSKLHIKCASIDTLVLGATHATFTGQATVDGVETTFQIDVDDFGDPGAGQDTFKIQTGSGYTAEGVLTAGNIQVRP